MVLLGVGFGALLAGLPLVLCLLRQQKLNQKRAAQRQLVANQAAAEFQQLERDRDAVRALQQQMIQEGQLQPLQAAQSASRNQLPLPTSHDLPTPKADPGAKTTVARAGEHAVRV